jgi:hypothetical protein
MWLTWVGRRVPISLICARLSGTLDGQLPVPCVTRRMVLHA